MCIRDRYDTVKASNSLARVYMPFDFRWNCGQLEGFKYGVMDMLPRLNALLKDTDYGIAWHAYPETFTDPVSYTHLQSVWNPLVNTGFLFITSWNRIVRLSLLIPNMLRLSVERKLTRKMPNGLLTCLSMTLLLEALCHLLTFASFATLCATVSN